VCGIRLRAILINRTPEDTEMPYPRFATYCVALFSLLAPGPAGAAVPLTLTHSGRLFHNAAPIDGDLSLIFSLVDRDHDDPPIWSETLDGVSFVDGYFSLALGETTPLTPAQVSALADAGERLELGITIVDPLRGEVPLLPRLGVTSVPFALAARTVECLGCIKPTALQVMAAYGDNSGRATDVECTSACIRTEEIVDKSVTPAKLFGCAPTELLHGADGGSNVMECTDLLTIGTASNQVTAKVALVANGGLLATSVNATSVSAAGLAVGGNATVGGRLTTTGLVQASGGVSTTTIGATTLTASGDVTARSFYTPVVLNAAVDQAFVENSYRDDRGRPNFIGNWKSSQRWGIGAASGGTDNVVEIGVTNGSTWSSPANLLVSNLSAGAISASGLTQANGGLSTTAIDASGKVTSADVFFASTFGAAGKPNFVGNWFSDGMWGIGSFSGSSRPKDDTVFVGKTDSAGSAWIGPANLAAEGAIMSTSSAGALPKFVGNWPSGGYFGIGPLSTAHDYTVYVGATPDIYGSSWTSGAILASDAVRLVSTSADPIYNTSCDPSELATLRRCSDAGATYITLCVCVRSSGSHNWKPL
jgi:hypothetical protein